MATLDQHRLPAPEEPKLLEPARESPPAPRSGRKLLLAGGGFILLLLLLFLLGYLPRHRRQKAVEEAARKRAQSIPVANVTRVKRSPPTANLLLPGNITPLTEAYIYARSTGYVRRRYVDIGDRVRTGQLLADIQAPDLDAQVEQANAMLAQSERQLSQARAQLENARAQEELGRVTWDRYRVLAEHGAISRQEADQQLATYRSAIAAVHLQEATIASGEENIRANRANLQHLVALQQFEHVTAPFTGVITARNFDVGALINGNGASLGASPSPLGGTQQSAALGNAGGTGNPTQPTPAAGPTSGGSPTSGGELYRMAQIGTLRILVNVPQENAPTIRVGQPATLFVQEFANRKFPGKVTRTSNALDQSSRTLLTEVQVENPQRILLPGMYTLVQFTDLRAQPPLLIPGDSLITTPEGLQVAILEDPTPQQRQRQQEEAGNAKRIHLQKVEVGRDYGPQIEITSGLQGWEYVVVNPEDTIQEGALVIPHAAPETAAQGEQERRGPSERQPSGIGAPSREAPTQGPQQSGKGNKGQQGGKAKKGSQKGSNQ